MGDFKRKKVMLAGLVVLAICVGVINNKLAEQRLLQTSADYVKYEGQQMRLYDETAAVVSSDAIGEDVLSEAATTEGAIAAADGEEGTELTSGEASGEEESEDVWDENEVTLVSSDNFAELNDKTTYFEEARAALNMDRNEILSMLTEFAEESEDEDAKQQAVDQKLNLIEYMSKEKTIENLLKNKGFQDAYVVITDQAVNVTVNKEELTAEDLAKVVDIVTRETQRPASQIVVQNKV